MSGFLRSMLAEGDRTGHHCGDNYHGPMNTTGGTTIIGGHGNTIVTSQDAETLLRTLPGWDLEGIRFDESKACLCGTRKQLLDDIFAWVYSSDGKRILWLSGGAGTGKSSVAHSCAVFFDRHHHLGASFFFNRDIAGLNNPKYFIANLCYQLAHFDDDGRLRGKIISKIRSMGHIAASSLRTQARKLIVETTNAANLTEPVVVVVDAIDEAGTNIMREPLLETIIEELSVLPDNIKVIITSRDEQDIRDSLETCSNEMCIEEAEKAAEDISSYIQHRFARICQRSHAPRSWPDLKKMQALCSRAGRLFVWASVACNYVEDGRDHGRRLNELLDLTNNHKGPAGSPLSKLNSLYHHIFENAFLTLDGRPTDFHYVVGSIVVLETPLTQIELDSLLGFEDYDGEGLVLPDGQVIHLLSSAVIVNHLRSILREDSTVPGGHDGPIRLLHPSLYDFLTIYAKDNFRIDVIHQHQLLATRCLHIMNNQLKFDICEIGDASLPNKEISEARRYMSAGLRYALFSFVFHCSKLSHPNLMLIEALEEFVLEHILHWIEAMGALNAVSKAEECLQTLAEWMTDQPEVDKRMQAIVCDAIALLRNCGQAVRFSALHAYYSALPLTPKTRELFKSYIGKVPGLPDVVSRLPLWPSSTVRILEGHTNYVKHVVFSPDGKKLASASNDCTLRLWDVESGQPIGGALTGHISRVSHVVFSPDGKKLASASNDKTLRLWDVESGQLIGDALKGHGRMVNHVVFSPDGKKLASASNDCTLRLWDVESGQPTGDALKGHNDCINHVVFSPDGKKLASASNDWTLRLWDIESGQSTGDALKGHASIVNHVVFSRDGKKLASTSDDCTLRLWDVENGQLIGNALKGHTRRVNHVVFSPDGKKLASASDDCTLRLWDVESGQPIGDALKGHTNWVNHVVFSSDGKKLASASNDYTSRLWDAESGQSIGGALKGHTSIVNHVVFSPDGKKFASASHDCTLRLWDVESGQLIGDELEGHTDRVNRVVFSPDGRKLASASDDCTLRLWDVESGQPIGDPLKGHTGNVYLIVFSPDGKRLASASSDYTLHLWDVESGQPIGGALKGHTWHVNHIVFSPDGKKLASAFYDRTLCLWDVESGQPVGDLLKGHTGDVYHIVFSPDGKKLASASHDCTLRLWDVESGQPIGDALRGHSRMVNHVVFSPDGKKLASASNDRTLRLWDVESGQPIGNALEIDPDAVDYKAFSLDEQLFSSLSQKTTKFRCGTSGEGIGITDAISTMSPTNGVWSKIQFHFDEHGFLLRLSRRLLWLPVWLRGVIDVHQSSVAIGSPSGTVTLIRWPVP